ncbi:MAG: DNA translocase FtsK 4TM domain-containing protein [Desulfovibrio sp.]|jgi:DNA segregation ATPase FtsK/SpoIIIE-like protein|nr:DNA translocase FtsK 4TM domain-containing protein [Desulfovibrio sp.]
MKDGGAKNSARTDESRLGRDLIGLFSIFFSILLILSLASFDGRDPWLNHVVGGSQNIRNKTGMFGAYTAGFLYDVFGAAAWVLPAFLSTAGARRILGAAPWPWRRWSGFLFAALCIGIAGASVDLADLGFFTRDALPAGSGNVSSHGGGLAGHMLYVWLRGWLGPTGAFLVWFFTLLSAVQLLSSLSLPLLAYAACVALKQRSAETLRAVAARRGTAPAGGGRQTGNADESRTELALHQTMPALSPRISASARESSAEQGVAASAGRLSPDLSLSAKHVSIPVRSYPPYDSAPADGNRADFSFDQASLPEEERQEAHPVVYGSPAKEASPVRDYAPEYRSAPGPADPGREERDALRAQGREEGLGAYRDRARAEGPDEYRDQVQAGELPKLPPLSADGALDDDDVDIPPWVHDFENDRLGPPLLSSVSEGSASAFDRLEYGERPVSGLAAVDDVPAEVPRDSAVPAEDTPAEVTGAAWATPAESAPATERPAAHGGLTDGAAEVSSFTFDFPDRVQRDENFSASDPEMAGSTAGPALRSAVSSLNPEVTQRDLSGRTEFSSPVSGAENEAATISPWLRRSSADTPATAGPGAGRALPAAKNEPAGTALLRPDPGTREASLPPLDILEAAASPSCGIQRDVLEQKGRDLMNCLHDFGIQGELAAITPGPVVTMFEIKPAPGVRVARIAGLSDDLALALKAAAVRIQAPVPGTDSVGIEIPNTTRETVCLKELLSSSIFRQSPSLLTIALGKDTAGNPVTADLASMPHLLVAGATGAGKSVGINSIILSILYKARPDQVKLLLVDPKRVEMSIYADLPHLVHPVVTEMPLAKSALEWAVAEMERRYDAIAGAGVRNITDYNARVAGWGGNPPPGMEHVKLIPFLVLIIDELADLMLVASKEVETSIIRLAQLARAAGIHLILATQRPSVDVVTGLIKANFPCRIAFQVTSKHDSRTILDTVGAEHLLGKGDMLFKPAGGKFRRLHGAFVSDRNVNAVAEYWKKIQPPDYTIDFADWGQEGTGPASAGGGLIDINVEPLYNEAVEFVRSQGKASISLIQRKFRIGFNKAARYVEQMEADGIIGPADGSKPRPVIK